MSLPPNFERYYDPEKINRTALKAWVMALRSGLYQQGLGRLKVESPGNGIQHCCLGVACEAALSSGLLLEETSSKVPSTSGEKLKIFMFGSQGLVMPSEVKEWLGLPDDKTVCLWFSPKMRTILYYPSRTSASATMYESDGQGWILAQAANDVYRATFTQIAEIIENTFDLKED